MATSVLGALLRSSGKPFLDHLVGTAGILMAVGSRPPVVGAAVLHVEPLGGWLVEAGQATLARRPVVAALAEPGDLSTS